MRQVTCLLGAVLCCILGTPAFAQTVDERLNALEKALAAQAATITEQQKVITTLKGELARQQEHTAADPAPAAAPAHEDHASAPAPAGGFFGGNALANPNISLVLDTFYNASTLRNDVLEQRGITGFTDQGLERRNGFNLRAAELFIFAPVDPYFNLYTNLPIDDAGIHLEEAYAVTTALPEGFQLKGGRFKSGISRMNAQHPHTWDFFDIALPYRAFLGNEGLGGENGVQLTWLPSLPVYTLLGAELLQGDNPLLFGSDARSGPHAFSFFAKSSFDTGDDATLYLGPSVLFGSTRSTAVVAGAEVTGHSALYGMEAVWKWTPSRDRAVTLQGEYLFLTQNGSLTDLGTLAEDRLERRQDGFYMQGTYRQGRWRLGARYDTLSRGADTFRVAGVQQQVPAAWRATGAVEFNPTEFTRIRLQYNHDESGRPGSTNDEAIVQFLFGIGAHAAHSF